MREYLGKPVDGSSLAVFRVGLGILMAWMAYGFLTPAGPEGIRLIDLISQTATSFHFSYPYLIWWKPLPIGLMEAVVYVCLTSSLMLAAGFLTQLAAAIVFLTFLYLWTCDASLFGNHFPLASVLVFLLIFVPSHRRFSLDAWLRPMPTSIPFWAILLLRAQVFLVYFFGGVSKLHADWLAGEPIRSWFHSPDTADSVRAAFGASADGLLVPLLRQEATVYFFSYGGLLFDLSIGVFLCVRRTRLLALLVATWFHAFNYFFVDKVGVVAPLSWWATLLFLDAQWPVRTWRWLRSPQWPTPDLGWFFVGMIAVPILGASLGWKMPASTTVAPTRAQTRMGWPTLTLVSIWLALQTIIPLRHFAIAGDAYWTEEGVAFSWFLLTRNKIGNFIQFRVVDDEAARNRADGEWEWNPPLPGIDHVTVEFASIDVRNSGEIAAVPEIFATYEPVFGYRIFCRAESKEHLDTLQERWLEHFGRPPRIAPTQTAEDILSELRAAAQTLSTQDEHYRDYVARLTSEIDFALRNLGDLRACRSNDPRRRVILQRLARSLERLAAARRLSPPMRALVYGAAPFSFQGADGAAGSFHLILDPSLGLPDPTIAGVEETRRIGVPADNLRRTHAPADSVAERRPVSFPQKRESSPFLAALESWPVGDLPRPVVYCDFSILPVAYMDPLPPVVAVRDPAGPYFLWNYTHELNSKRIEAMSLFPYLLRQYAEHVSDEWHAVTGRRPEIFITAYAWLNTHDYHPLIDPTVDLARVRYDLLRHNEWILDRRWNRGAGNSAR